MDNLKRFFILFCLLVGNLVARADAQGANTITLNKTKVNICLNDSDTVYVKDSVKFERCLWQVFNKDNWEPAHIFSDSLFPVDTYFLLPIAGDPSLNGKLIRCLADTNSTEEYSATSDTIFVKVYDPIVDPGIIFGDSFICSGDSSVLTESVSVDTNATFYHWTLPLWASIISVNADSSSITFSGSTTTSSIIKVTPYNPGCSGPPTQKTIDVIEHIVIGSIDGPENLCIGNETKYTAVGCENATNYSWTVPSWVTITSAHDNIITLIAIAQAPDSLISVTPSNSCFIGEKASKTISVYDKLTSGIIGPDTAICFGNPSGILSFNSPPMGSDGNYDYKWQDSTASSTWGNIPTGTDTTYSPGILDITHFYRVQVKSDFCNDSAITNIIKVKVNPLPNGTISGPASVCKNQYGVLYSVITGVTDNIYVWDLQNSMGTISPGEEPWSIYIHWKKSSGWEKIELKIKDENNCTGTTDLPVEVLDKSAPDTTTIIQKPGSNLLVCSETGTGINYRWGIITINTDSVNYCKTWNYRYILLDDSINTSLYKYFVDTYYNDNGNTGCTTRSFANPDNLKFGYGELIKGDQFPLVFPNPSNGIVTVLLPDSYSKSDIQVRLYDMEGRLHFNTFGNPSKLINLALPTGLQQGLYILQLVSETNPIFSTRLIIIK